MLTARCRVAGGGPTGMMPGLLLARAGIDVIVLEKHADFPRDFRGDTIHPSTMEGLHEVGLPEAFLKLPYTPTSRLGPQFGNETMQVADFSHLPTQCKFIAMMPRWEFLNFIAEAAHAYNSFRLMMRAEATGLTGRGLVAQTPDGEITIDAPLVIASDGRHSTPRDAAGSKVTEFGAPMPVFWLRLSRCPDDPADTLGRVATGRMMVTLNRGDYLAMRLYHSQRRLRGDPRGHPRSAPSVCGSSCGTASSRRCSRTTRLSGHRSRFGGCGGSPSSAAFPHGCSAWGSSRSIFATKIAR